MPSDPLTLAFDTSAAHCAAALLSGDTLVAARHIDMAKGQAENLVPLLEDVLFEGGIGWSDLTRIGVGIGPGNFTGIRISVATARGLSQALNIPAIGVSTFDALYEGATGMALVAIDARGGRTYVQLIDRTGSDPKARDMSHPPEIIEGPVAPPLPDRAASIALTPPWQQNMTLEHGCPRVAPHYPVAEAIARVAARSSTQTPPTPLYIRKADAAPPRDHAPVILP